MIRKVAGGWYDPRTRWFITNELLEDDIMANKPTKSAKKRMAKKAISTETLENTRLLDTIAKAPTPGPLANGSGYSPAGAQLASQPNQASPKESKGPVYQNMSLDFYSPTGNRCHINFQITVP